MGGSSSTTWFHQIGTTEGGKPLVNILVDSSADELRLELRVFPDHLLSYSKGGLEPGTLLQIAVRRGEAAVVQVIVQELLDRFNLAVSESEFSSPSDPRRDFIHSEGGGDAPRLLNEDPVELGSLSGLLEPLGLERRRAVAMSLLAACRYLYDPRERATIGFFADSPEIALSRDTKWPPLYQLLISMEFGARVCCEEVLRAADGLFDEVLLLHEAAQRGLTGAIRWLVDNGYDPNERDSGGRTPLHIAADAGCVSSVETLIHLGGNPWAETLQGDVPLISAIRSGKKECALFLSHSIGEVNSETVEKAMSVAIQAEMFDIASAILKLEYDSACPTALSLERMLTDVVISVETCRWLFALLVPILSSPEHNTTEVMPLLTRDEFQYAARLAGIECDSPEASIELFLKTLTSNIGLYEKMHSHLMLYGAPVCLLLCASSLAVAITKDNSSFHQLHPQMRSLFGQKYEDSHLGEAWENLRSWMDTRGLVLAWPQDNWLRNVGPPLYHAIWRPDDREKLFEALGSLGVSPLSPITTAEMDVYLRKKSDMFSTHIKKMLSSDKDRDALLRSACSNLSVSRVVRSSRVRSIQARDLWATLSWRRDLRTRRISLQAILPCRVGMPDSISFADGNEYLSNGETYQRVTLEASWVDNDRIVSREGYTFRIPSIKQPLAFTVSGEKAQRYSLMVGDGQLIICPNHLKETISSFLAQVQDDEVMVTQIEQFPELVALGPFIPLREVHGCLMMTERQNVHGELFGGLRFRGNTYHHLALPYVVLHGFVVGEECSWMVDGSMKAVEACFGEDGQVLVYPPTGGVHYCLLVSGNYIEGTRFDAAQSVNDCRDEEPRNRWPLLLPEKGEFHILGVSGFEIAKVRLTRKCGVLTVPFEPCWAIDVKARPLSAVVPRPDEIAFRPITSDMVKDVRQASAGDAMSQKTAQKCWESYQRKARQ